MHLKPVFYGLQMSLLICIDGLDFWKYRDLFIYFLNKSLFDLVSFPLINTLTKAIQGRNGRLWPTGQSCFIWQRSQGSRSLCQQIMAHWQAGTGMNGSCHWTVFSPFTQSKVPAREWCHPQRMSFLTLINLIKMIPQSCLEAQIPGDPRFCQGGTIVWFFINIRCPHKDLLIFQVSARVPEEARGLKFPRSWSYRRL